MSRQPQSTSPSPEASTGELAELERAATALREKCLEQFRLKRDSSALNFYKSVAFLPKEFRVMWLHEHSSSYRTKPEFDESDLHATRVLREEIGQHVKLFCQELSALMKWFVENLRQMRQDIVWIESETDKIWPMIENEYPIWTQIACYGRPAGQDWQAPGWLNNWPADLPPRALLSAAREGRLNPHRTANVLKVIGNRIKERLALEQESALNELHIRFAQEKEKIVGLERKRAREDAIPIPSEQVPEPAMQAPPTARRLTATIESASAARRMEAYLKSKGIGQTEFANQVRTTDRTLRAFRKTGKVRRDIFTAIAEAMGTTKEALLKPD